MDEICSKVKGQWRYLYRAVDQYGQTIDLLPTEQHDEPAATRFLTKAIRRHGMPETITIDGSEANASAMRSYNEAHGTTIIIRQVKYLNNVVEQDHRAVKRLTHPVLGSKRLRRPRARWRASSSCICSRRAKWWPRKG
jgi:putative transposase